MGSLLRIRGLFLPLWCFAHESDYSPDYTKSGGDD